MIHFNALNFWKPLRFVLTVPSYGSIPIDHQASQISHFLLSQGILFIEAL
jgi:hypothetical protein